MGQQPEEIIIKQRLAEVLLLAAMEYASERERYDRFTIKWFKREKEGHCNQEPRCKQTRYEQPNPLRDHTDAASSGECTLEGIQVIIPSNSGRFFETGEALFEDRHGFPVITITEENKNEEKDSYKKHLRDLFKELSVESNPICRDLRPEHEIGKGKQGLHFEFVNLPSQDPDKCLKALAQWFVNKGDKSSSQQNPTPTTVIPYNLPLNVVARFVGRDGDKLRLHQELRDLKPNELLSVVGMGGIGKTELVLQYAIEYCDFYDGGVAWIQVRGGEDPVTQLLSFASTCGYQLNTNLPLHSQLASVWNAWQGNRTLIIFDDVDNLNEIRSAIPSRNDKFLILLTTRYQFSAPAKLMEIDVLTEEASLTLLESLVGKQRIDREISYSRKLCEFVDGLPLGLELIGKYLRNRTDLSIQTIYEKLDRKRQRWRESSEMNVINDSAFQFNPKNLSTAQRGAMECFDLTWEQLSKDAQGLGKLLCSYDESCIVWERVYTVLEKFAAAKNRTEELENIADIRSELTSFSLLKMHQEGEYYYHPLLKDFFRSKMTKLEIQAWEQEIY